jgi:hypothetical protein
VRCGSQQFKTRILNSSRDIVMPEAIASEVLRAYGLPTVGGGGSYDVIMQNNFLQAVFGFRVWGLGF